jgi:beta-lactam-binding protein with PASTA domain
VEYLKAFAREVWLFLSSRIFLINFAKMAGVVLVLVLLTNGWLRCYTNHGESVQVEDFTGLHILDAKKQGHGKDFRFEVIDSVWQEGKPGGIIQSQNPPPFARVKEGRKIYVTVTQWQPELVRLPQFSLSSYDYDRYAAKIARRSIKSRVKERVFDKKQAENTILYFYFKGEKITERDIKNGYDVPMGSTLDFVVTERLSNVMEIPDLMCMTFSTAEFLVSTSNLNIGLIEEDATVTNRSTAYIFRQEPPFDSLKTIPMGGQINVWLTQEKPVNCNETVTEQDDEGN